MENNIDVVYVKMCNAIPVWHYMVIKIYSMNNVAVQCLSGNLENHCVFVQDS
jgi:hypothetical protein